MNNENALSGYFKTYRSIVNWEWFKDQNTLQVFILILALASFKDSRWQGVEIKKGQLICSRATIQEKTGLSEQSVKTALNHLKATNEITIKPTNRFSLITIVNYTKYQEFEREPTNQVTNEKTDNQPTDNQQITNSQPHRKNVKNVNTVNIVNKFIVPIEIQAEWDDFMDMRVKIKKPATEKAKQLLLSKLQKLSSNPQTQKQILNQSTINSWQDIYALKADGKQTAVDRILRIPRDEDVI